MKYQVIDWRIQYAARWRPISGPQADAFEKFLAANLRGGVTSDELDKVVASLCETWRREDQVPTVRNILFEAIRLRSGGDQGSDKKIDGYRRVTNEYGHITNAPESYSMGEMRKALREARPEHRWAIVCWPAKAEDCHLLEQMALEMDGGCPKDKIDWSKFRMPEMRVPEERTPDGPAVQKAVSPGPGDPLDSVAVAGRVGVPDEDEQSVMEFEEALGPEKKQEDASTCNVAMTNKKEEDDW